ncbi:MAG TPA: ATP-binding protein [Gallionella sp.]|nr:ATP-binding protein [Gallionella sp.]
MSSSSSLFGSRIGRIDFHIDESNLRIRAEQLRTRMSMYPSLILSQLLLQPLFVWLYWDHAPHYWLLLWLATFYAFHAVEFVKWERDRSRLNTLAECADWHNHFTVFALGAGILWAVGAVVFFPIEINEQSVLISVMLGLVAGAVTMNPVHPPSLYAFVLGIMFPLIVQVGLADDLHHWLLALMLALFTTVILYAGHGLNKTFVSSLQQRFENADLLQQLSLQKAATEAARSQLEKANIELNETLQELQSVNASLEVRVIEQTHQTIEKERLLIQQSRSAAMGEMISNIAHQWRQPLSTLSLVVQNILFDYRENQLNREELEEYVDTAQQCVTSMSETIDDFRNFFRPDKIKVTFNLHDAVAESIRLLEATLKNHKIQVSMSEDSGLRAYGHVNEFSQVILNVLANAKDALVENKPDKRRIEIELKSTGHVGMVVIRDNAGGIPEDAQDKIFDPYFTTKVSGTGIGLYMSKTIIEKHMDGNIACRNTADGAEFTISIPLGQGNNTGGA